MQIYEKNQQIMGIFFASFIIFCQKLANFSNFCRICKFQIILNGLDGLGGSGMDNIQGLRMIRVILAEICINCGYISVWLVIIQFIDYSDTIISKQ